MLLTSGQVARELSTTVPRVLRAVRGGGIPTVRRGNRFLFDAAGVKALRQRLGATPRIPGLTREDVLVLAALGRRPFGLGSVRAVARASGVSPTTAGRSLRRLVDQGYVARETVRVAEGKARDVTVWTERWAAPSWLRVAAKAGQVLLPAESPAPARASGRGLPARLGHLFWNETPQSLDLDRHATWLPTGSCAPTTQRLMHGCCNGFLRRRSCKRPAREASILAGPAWAASWPTRRDGPSRGTCLDPAR